MMNPEIKKLWIEALKSGKFNIDNNAGLKTIYSHSLIGSLLEIIDPNKFKQDTNSDRYSFDGLYHVPNMEILRKIDLNDEGRKKIHSFSEYPTSIVAILLKLDDTI